MKRLDSMRILLPILAAAIALLGNPLFASGDAQLSPEVAERIAHLRPGETIPIVVTLAEQVDLARHGRGRAGAGDLILDLKETARRSQAPVLAALDKHGFKEQVQSFWIQNCILLVATPHLIRALVALRAVERIDLDLGGSGEGVFVEENARDTNFDRDTYWNMDLIGAPAIWSTLGLDGEGIVIGSMDSGIDTNHPALVGKWRGGSNSWRDIINALPDPYDDHGHGTHTIGTMVGGDGPGPFTEDIGLAYSARVISAKILDANNTFSSTGIPFAGAQWILDPDDDPLTDDFPHVVNNSWRFGNPTYTGFYGSVAAWRAAGIIPVGIVTNFGPAPETTKTPGNYNNIYGVGATTSVDTVASFSSRGPSPVGAMWPPDRRKPEFVAPGSLVRSSWLGGIYVNGSGTSMAAPHVAASAAIMLQAAPGTPYEDIRTAIITTAVDISDPGYDFNAGYGRLDAFAAVESVLETLAVEPLSSPGGPRFQLSPNPFHGQVEIRSADGPSGLHLEIIDVQGRRVRRLGTSESATSLFVWDGTDERGNKMPAGAYFIRAAGRGMDPWTGRLIKIP